MPGYVSARRANLRSRGDIIKRKTSQTFFLKRSTTQHHLYAPPRDLFNLDHVTRYTQFVTNYFGSRQSKPAPLQSDVRDWRPLPSCTVPLMARVGGPAPRSIATQRWNSPVWWLKAIGTARDPAHHLHFSVSCARPVSHSPVWSVCLSEQMPPAKKAPAKKAPAKKAPAKKTIAKKAPAKVKPPLSHTISKALVPLSHLIAPPCMCAFRRRRPRRNRPRRSRPRRSRPRRRRRPRSRQPRRRQPRRRRRRCGDA